MTIPEFIEKAIEGGWNEGHRIIFQGAFGDILLAKENRKAQTISTTIHEILLDPLAWQAVGKVEGWTHDNAEYGEYMDMPLYQFKERHWKTKMHDMIDALAEGKSITEYLETL